MLRRSGCYPTGEGTRHEQWYSPLTGEYFSVGRHNREEVAPGTLSRIRKESGVKL